MRISPFNPPVIMPERPDGPAGVDAVTATHAVATTAVPAFRMYRPVPLEPLRQAELERRHKVERRQVCLLRQPLPWLLEFRQQSDRRRRNRRQNDYSEHVDELA